MLQGSLDNFGLDEVLGLLADTAKTGRMRITGDRGSGSLWLVSGKLVGSEASRADAAGPIDETMFELLRFNTGNFSFNSDETPTEAAPATDVATVLEAAFDRLTQWREIEAVVPSLAHVIAPVSSLPAPEMTITAAEWDLLMAIGAGTEVGSVCEHFGLGEVEGSRRVKLLVERSLITIAPPHAASASTSDHALATDSDDFGLAPAGLTTDEIASPASVGAFDAAPTPVAPEHAAPVAPATASAHVAAAAPVAEAAPTAHIAPPAEAAPATPPHPGDRFGADAFGEAPVATPTDAGFLDPGERAWNPLGDDADHDSIAEATVADLGEEPDEAEASAPLDVNEFSFRPDPPAVDPRSGLMRRASDALPPPPPPAPPAAFEQFDAPTPPPPAPPSPADLVGSERVDGAEARRLLSGRGTERYDFEVADRGVDDEEDDGSLLMQYLRDES